MILGVDPGLAGGIFLLDPRQPSTGTAFDIPTHQLTRGGKPKREVDIQCLLGLLSPGLEHAFVERVGAMPGQGVSSSLAFGKCGGIILGVLAALRVPVTEVPPAQWKRALGVPKAKDGARARAGQLMPEEDDEHAVEARLLVEVAQMAGTGEDLEGGGEVLRQIGRLLGGDQRVLGTREHQRWAGEARERRAVVRARRHRALHCCQSLRRTLIDDLARAA